MMRIFLACIWMLCVFVQANAQQKIPTVKGWRVHLPYYKNNSIVEASGALYAASQSGLIKMTLQQGELTRLSKINGLGDVEVRLIRHHAGLQKSIVLYESAMFDVIDHVHGTITHFPQVKEQVMIGAKQINNVCFDGNKAYLACSFGLVVVDLEQMRIIDSYQNIGPDGQALYVNDVEVFQNSIYACTPAGLFSASLDAPNLSDYNYWHAIGAFSSAQAICNFGNNLYLFANSFLHVSNDGSIWNRFNVNDTATELRSLEISQGRLFATYRSYVMEVNSAKQVQFHYDWKYCNQVIATSDARIAIVDDYYGIRLTPGKGAEYDYVIADGPNERNAKSISYANGKLWVAAGSVNDLWEKQYDLGLFYRFSGNTWANVVDRNYDEWKGINDIVDVRVNPYNGRTFAASQGKGLFEIDPESFHIIQNWSDKIKSPSGFVDQNASSIDFDQNGTMWIANHLADKPLVAMSADGSWTSFSIGNALNGVNRVCKIHCDFDNNKWVTVVGNAGVLVYNDNGTPLNPNDDQYKVLNKDEGNGFFPSNTVLCAVPDLNGEVWIGTDQGLCILSSPSLIFDKSSGINFDAHQIVIKTGLVYSNFLGTEMINCIKVDGANRKWIGTRNGVWLVSSDGYTVIHNYTTKNSPLLSDNVTEIGIDESTGEVFFSTDKGLVSFMGDATQASESFGDVVIYPNPVRPNYSGSICIRGLASDCNVKIMDMGGRLVYETYANGGMATWDGNTFAGKRAASGVYLIMAATRNGEEVYSGKLVFMH